MLHTARIRKGEGRWAKRRQNNMAPAVAAVALLEANPDRTPDLIKPKVKRVKKQETMTSIGCVSIDTVYMPWSGGGQTQVEASPLRKPVLDAREKVCQQHRAPMKPKKEHKNKKKKIIHK